MAKEGCGKRKGEGTSRIMQGVFLMLLFCMALAAGGVKVQAAGMSLADLQAKFPDGKYWNHATADGHDYNEATLVHFGNCNNPDGYTDMPCTNHNLDIQGAGYYDCNSYGGGLQCCGFAYKLADDAYGSMPNSWGTVSVDSAKAGDVIHFHTGDAYGHWAMIIGRNGTTVTLGECNYDYHCRIDWGRVCDLSGQSYTIYSAPWELQAGTSSVQPEPEPDNKYNVSDNGDGTVTITGCSYRHGENIEIPSEIDGKKVTGIGEKAFSGNLNLKSVTISEGVTSIGNEAFYGCTNLDSITIPESVTSIGNESFRRCSNLKSIDISGGEISIGELAFSECGLTNVNISGEKISIGVKAFLYCNDLESIIIPGSVTDIGQEAFEICQSLKSVVIQDGVMGIGKSAFERCRCLENVTIPGSVRNIGAGAFNECDNLTSVIIQDGVTSIGSGAFSQCGNLESVTIPGSVTDIDEDIFLLCYKLHEGFHNGVETTGVIYVESGSIAEQYAKEQHLRFMLIQASGSSKGESNLPASCAHFYKTSVIPATAKTNGSIVEKCTKCGNEKSRAVIYAVNSISLSKISYTYNGKTYRPSVTVKDSVGKKLKNNTDYTVSFPDKAKNAGRYTVTVTLRGNYGGTVKKTFDIVPKGTSISKVTAKKKGFTVKWKKQAKQTTGYEVQYSSSSKFAGKSTKITDAGKSSAVSKSVSKLKAKKKYYVRIRTYKTTRINGKSVKLYSGWSKARAVTTKK